MSVDLSKMCRCCMALDGALISLYENRPMSGKSSIAEMLKGISTLLPRENDGLPEKVCLPCISEINRAFSFKLKCENAEVTLRQLIPEITDLIEEQIEDEDAHPNENNIKNEMEVTMEIIIPVNQEQEPLLQDESEKQEKSLENENDYLAEENAKEQIQLQEEGEEEEHEKESSEVLGDTNDFSEADELDRDHSHGETETDEGPSEFYIVETGNNDGSPGNNDDNIIVKKRKSPRNINKASKKGQISKDKQTVKKFKLEHACPSCPMFFVHKKNLEKHIEKHHPSPDMRYIAVANSEELRANEVKQFKINSDDPVNADDGKGNRDYVEVMEIIEEDNVEIDNERLRLKHICKQCGAGFAIESSLKYHLMRNKCTQPEYTCGTCSKVFINEEKLKIHIQIHQKLEACLLCPEKFKDKDLLKAHHLKMHKERVKNHCITCNKVFTMLSSLKDHMRIHSGERPFLCNICGKGFNQNANLKQHVMRHGRVKPYGCNECNDSFVSKGELNSHMRTHTGDHPFVCELCAAGFTTASSLAKHKRIHTGERPYACEFCPMRFTALNTLKNHRRTHTGEKPFACEFCERKFTQKSDCSIHMRTHTGERPFSCPDCGASFHQSGTLKNHMKTHANGKESKRRKLAESAAKAIDNSIEEELQRLEEQEDNLEIMEVVNEELSD